MFEKLLLFYHDSCKNKKYIALAIVTYFLYQIFVFFTFCVGFSIHFLFVMLLGGRDALFVAFSIMLFFPNIYFLVMSSVAVLKICCKKRSNVTMSAVLVCLVLTAIFHLLGYTWIFSFLEGEGGFSRFLMNFFIPKFWLFPKYINYFGRPCSIIVFLISFAISYGVALKRIKNVFCQNCEYAKEEYSTASLLFPSYVIDALKSGTVELSSLENLKLGLGDYPLKIKIILCHHCRQSSISVYSIENMTSGKLFENSIYKNDNVDYVWAQKLANYYESEFRKKRN